MKKIILCLCSAIILLTFACKKDHARELLIVNKTNITLPGFSGSLDSFTIQYSGSWSISKDPASTSWIGISKTSGIGNATVYVSASQSNPAAVVRNAALRVIPDGDNSRMVEVTITQKTVISWSRIFGGSQYDIFNVLLPTPEGGYIGAGYVASNDFDAAGNHGGDDAWVVKMDGMGQVIWKKTYGGTGTDRAEAMVPASDGGYIILGYTSSNNGDVMKRHKLEDVWIIKIDDNGNLLWQKTYGGDGGDIGTSIINTADNGYLVGAYTFSEDGDVTSQHNDSTILGGSGDVWLLKVDVAGNLQWQKAYGGTANEFCNSLTKALDGGYVVVGNTNATIADGDVQPSRGSYDLWAFKIDATGNLQWQNSFGGSRSDDARKVLALNDGYIVSGVTESNDGQVTGNHGSADAWILKIGLSGNLIWQRAFGGKHYESAWHLIRDANDFVFCADAESNDGDLTGNTDSDGSWIVKIDANGNIIQQKVFGGAGDDDPGHWIILNPDKSYTVAAVTTGSSGDVPPGNHGFFDAWVFTLRW